MSGKKTEYVTCSTCDGYGKITSEQQEIENLQTQIQIDAAINYANIQTENAALKAMIGDVIASYEQYGELPSDIIDSAKKLLDKQPQSESDRDKNLG